MSTVRTTFQKGFTLIEVLAVLAIMLILAGITFTTFKSFNSSQAVDKDVEVILSVLNEARSRTLSSENDTQYGVHIASTSIVLYTGATYASGSASNKTIPLSGHSALTLSLGGASDVLFERLTGESSATGTIVLTAVSNSSLVKTIRLYGTGLAETN